MTSAPAPRPRPTVLSGGHRSLAALLVLLLPLSLAAAAAPAGDDGDRKPAPPPETEGQEGKKGDKGEKGGKEGKGTRNETETRKKTEDEVLLETLGAAWKKRDAKGLAERFPAKRKVALRLPGIEEGQYRAEQARSVLEGWFAGRTFSKVELKGVKEGTGSFRVEYVRAADRRTVAADLLLALATEEKKRVLVGARESP